MSDRRRGDAVAGRIWHRWTTRHRIAESAPVNATSALLTTNEIRNLNGAANRPDADVAAIASHWWSEVGS